MSTQLQFNTDILTSDEIEEIHAIFNLLDIEGLGYLTCENLRIAFQAMSKNPNISGSIVTSIFCKIDLDHDAKISWEDFLGFVCIGLVNYGVVKPRIRTDIPLYSAERENLHKCIGGILTQGLFYISVTSLELESMESRIETWDYLAEGMIYTYEEKAQLYEKVQGKVQEANFLMILEKIISMNYESIYLGLKELKEMLAVLYYFPSSHERLGISNYLLMLFNQIYAKNILKILTNYLNNQNEEIVWITLEIITLITPGPRLPNFLSESYNFVVYAKNTLFETGSLMKIFSLCESKCIEIRDQALLAIGFITRYDPIIRNYFMHGGAIYMLVTLLKKGISNIINLETLVRATWLLSIFAGASMPKKSECDSLTFNDFKIIADVIFGVFQAHDDATLFANGLISLSLVLPKMPLSECRWYLERLVQLIDNSNYVVNKTVLETIVKIVMTNNEQCRMIIDLGIVDKLQTILACGNNDAKLDCLKILKFVIHKGYAKYIAYLSNLSILLQSILNNDNDTRWEAIKIFKIMVQSETRIIIE